MFTTTAPERAAVAGAQLDCYAVLEAQNPDGAFVRFDIDLDPDVDFFNSVTLHDDIDSNAMSMAAELLRDMGPGSTLSLAPLLESSTLNRDALDAYAPMLDLVRMWRVSVCVLPHGDPAPTFPDDYHEIGKGYIDAIQVDDVSPTIQVTGRGEEAAIIKAEILELVTYSIGSTDDMETVIQALLDDNMGVAAPTLYVPTPTSFIINEYTQDYGNLMGAVSAIASLAGYVLRYRYDAAGVNRLTLFQPLREAEQGAEDWEIGPTEYLRLPVNKFDIFGVRNHVIVRYVDEVTGEVATYTTPAPPTSPSIDRFGQIDLPIDLGKDSQITTSARAFELAQAVRADLEFPKLEQQFETYGFWFVQLTDWGKTPGNGVMY